MSEKRLPDDVLADLELPRAGNIDEVCVDSAFAKSLREVSGDEAGLYVARMYSAGACGVPDPEAVLALFLASIFNAMPDGQRIALLERVGLTKNGALPFMVGPKEDRAQVVIRFAVLAKMMGVDVSHEEELPTVPNVDLRTKRP